MSARTASKGAGYGDALDHHAVVEASAMRYAHTPGEPSETGI
jgi:hypothetical protein